MKNRKKPSTFNRILKSLAELSDSKNRQAPGKITQGRVVKTCQYWNCNINVRSNHFLCAEHYEDYQEYLIDKCPECGRFKDVGFDVCKDCYGALQKRSVDKKSKSPIRREYSKTWEKGDQGVENFFVYILKDEQGEFYPGQTRDLRIRYGYHTDGKVKSTAGRKQKLVYYETLSSRQKATSREAELKTLINKNPFKIRKMIQDFADNHKLITLD